MSASFLEESMAVLERTPGVLSAMLRGLPLPWILATEGPGTWSPYVVLGHLIHGEKTDWMARLEIILRDGTARTFDPVDREAQFRNGTERPLEDMLEEFTELRRANLERLSAFALRPEQLELQGTHPAFGTVTLRQLLAAWTAHDLAHTLQISRVMARRYREEVGPWAQYLSVLGDREG